MGIRIGKRNKNKLIATRTGKFLKPKPVCFNSYARNSIKLNTINNIISKMNNRLAVTPTRYDSPYIIIPSSNNDKGVLPHVNDNLRHKLNRLKQYDVNDISYLNKYICELTSLYYLYKFIDSDIIGLEHYRRCFINDGKYLNEEQINNLLKDCDILVYDWGKTHQQHTKAGNIYNWIAGYMKWCNTSQNLFDVFLKTVSNGDKNFVKYVYDYYKSTMMAPPLKTGKVGFIACLMFIGKKEVVHKWCDFVFNGIDKIFTVDMFNKYPTLFKDRTIGYLYEFIFGAWLNYNHINFKAINVKAPY